MQSSKLRRANFALMNTISRFIHRTTIKRMKYWRRLRLQVHEHHFEIQLEELELGIQLCESRSNLRIGNLEKKSTFKAKYLASFRIRTTRRRFKASQRNDNGNQSFNLNEEKMKDDLMNRSRTFNSFFILFFYFPKACSTKLVPPIIVSSLFIYFILFNSILVLQRQRRR